MIWNLASLFHKFTTYTTRKSGKTRVTERVHRNYMISWNNSQYPPSNTEVSQKKVCSVIPRIFSEFLYINLLPLASSSIFLPVLQRKLIFINHHINHCAAATEKLTIQFAYGKIFSACFPQKKPHTYSCLYSKEHHINHLLYVIYFHFTSPVENRLK